MFVAGIDAHATYSVIAIVSNTGQLVQGPVRIKNTEEERLLELFEPYRPVEVVVETSPAWPWLFDRLEGSEVQFVLAHAKRLRVIAESNYNSATRQLFLAELHVRPITLWTNFGVSSVLC